MAKNRWVRFFFFFNFRFQSVNFIILYFSFFFSYEKTYAYPGDIPKSEERQLDETGINFVKKCIEVIESRGLEEQGLYRIVGVNSKVNKLLTMVLDRRKADKLNLEDPYEWESKTLTSALKNFLRNLPEPLMTYKLHDSFIEAASKSPFFFFLYIYFL